MSESKDEKIVEMNSFVKESIQILREAYLSKKLVLFVGSGADIDSGIPSWSSAIHDFCDHLHLEYEAGTDYLRIPQYYFNSRGKKEYVELCKKIFRHGQQLQPNEFHGKIAAFHVDTMITTNYTDFLEQEMNRRGYIYRTVCQDKDLPYVHHEKLIVKMHGDFAHDNFVLKEDDYLKYHKNFRLIETYVKSVITNHVVLFLGYSFQDPDLKQLFSWVKDIVGDDFQQAYLLEGIKDYNKNEFEYYRNLGVNILYTNSYRKDKKDALFAVMDMIRQESSEQLSGLEEAKRYFTPYLHFNHILHRYVEKGLSMCHLGVDGDKICALGRQEEEVKETNALLKKISEDFKKKEEDVTSVHGVLAGVLKKSGIRQIRIYTQNEKQIEYELIEVPQTECKMLQQEMEFNYPELRKMAEHHEFFDDSEKTYAKQAFLYYLTDDFVKAYQALCKTARISFEQKNYYQYYLAQFNRLRIAHMIKGIIFDEIPKDIYDRIQEDVEHIKLETILSDIPCLSYQDTEMLKEIDSFQLHYSLFQDIYRMAENVKVEHNTTYLIFGKLPEFEKLRCTVKDYYLYLRNNYIMVDRYQESKEVFVLYVKSMLENVSAADKQGSWEYKKLQPSNIHASKLNRFELFLMIKYMSKKEMLNSFAWNGIEVLPVEEDCMDYMKTVVNNLKSDRQKEHDCERWNSILVCAYMHADEELAELALDCITENPDAQSCVEHKDIILRLIRVCGERSLYKQKQDGLFQMDDYALGRLLNTLLRMLIAEKDSLLIRNIGTLIQTVSDVFCRVYEEGCTADIEPLLCDEKAMTVAKIYPNCSEKNQQIIRQYFTDWKKTQRNQWELYFHLVTNHIIDQSEEFEQSMLEQIDYGKSDQCEEILIMFYNLYMNNQWIHVEELKNILKNTDSLMLRFLGGMDEFDYDKFQIAWLSRWNDKMLRKVAFHNIARSNIVRRFTEENERGEISRPLLNIYFKYFAHV